jgi:hypothetical protein
MDESNRNRDFTKSAKTVMKRSFPHKMIDLTSDPVGLGIRPSTAIQLKQIERTYNHNKSLPPNKQNQALPLITANNVGSISRVIKDPKKGTVEFMTKFNAIGLIDDFTNNRDSHACKLSQ